MNIMTMKSQIQFIKFAHIVPFVNLPVMGPINFLILKYWAFRKREAISGYSHDGEMERRTFA